MKTRWLVWMACLVLLGPAGCGRSKRMGEESFIPVAPPEVSAPIGRHRPARVGVDLEVVETVSRLADGVEVVLATYGGSVPGPFVRVREGDHVEFRLHNHPDNRHEHGIVIHAATGPGAGGDASLAPPGFSSTVSFHARTPGLFLYQSPSDQVGTHGGAGLFGLILVEPQAGLPTVQHEYYLVRSEFYTQGSFGEPGLQAFSPEKALRGAPEYVVFNGAVDALSGEGALAAEVWQTTRFYIGNAGPGLTASLRVHGQPFERVYREGNTQPDTMQQSVLLPPGGAAIVDVLWEAPGIYPLVDASYALGHARGALAEVYVTGPENPALFDESEPLAEYQPGTRLSPIPDVAVATAPIPVPVPVPAPAQAVAPLPAVAPAPSEASSLEAPVAPVVAAEPVPVPAPVAPAEPEYDLAASLARGEQTYQSLCMVCHQATGLGLPGVFPPLAGSDYLFDDIDRAIHLVLHGKQGVIVVNGVEYNQVMLAQNLDDEQTADVLNYVLNSWGNEHDEVITPTRVARVRAGEPAPAAAHAPAATAAAPAAAIPAAPAPEPPGMLIEIPIEPEPEPEPTPQPARVEPTPQPPAATAPAPALAPVVPVPAPAPRAPVAESVTLQPPTPAPLPEPAPEPTPAPEPAPAWMSLEESMQVGQTVYMRLCFACHQADGKGIPGIFPPLANSDYLLEDVDRAINVVLRGMEGEIVVNGVTYNQVMPPQNLDNAETAHVLNYVLNSWGNTTAEMITPEWVSRIRTEPPTP